MTKRAIDFTNPAFIAALTVSKADFAASVMARIDEHCAVVGKTRNDFFAEVMRDLRTGNTGKTFVGEAPPAK
jgi:hypothetical protein